MEKASKFGLVESIKVGAILEETDDQYLMSGEWCNYWIDKSRVKVLNNEYAVILNLYGSKAAYDYAKI